MVDVKQKLCDQLDENDQAIQQQWREKVSKAGIFKNLNQKELEERGMEKSAIILKALRTGDYSAAESYAAGMAKKAIVESMTVDQIMSGFLVLRDVFGRFIKKWYKDDYDQLLAVLDVYEPVARAVVSIVAMAFVKERDSIVKQQQDAILKLSTPLVQLYEKIALLPLIGILDSVRAKQLIESVLVYIGENKTEIIILDIAGIAAIDTKTAHHILMTIQAARLMGTEIIITGIRPEVATTLVTLSINMTGVVTRSTLRDGVEYAFNKLGFEMTGQQGSMHE